MADALLEVDAISKRFGGFSRSIGSVCR